MAYFYLKGKKIRMVEEI